MPAAMKPPALPSFLSRKTGYPALFEATEQETDDQDDNQDDDETFGPEGGTDYLAFGDEPFAGKNGSGQYPGSGGRDQEGRDRVLAEGKDPA